MVRQYALNNTCVEIIRPLQPLLNSIVRYTDLGGMQVLAARFLLPRAEKGLTG